MRLVIALLSVVCVAVLSIASVHHGTGTADAAVTSPAVHASTSCAAPDADAPQPAMALLGLDDHAAPAGKCVPAGDSCKGPGKKCCGYCCSGTCRKHANCKD